MHWTRCKWTGRGYARMYYYTLEVSLVGVHQGGGEGREELPDLVVRLGADNLNPVPLLLHHSL